MADPDVDLLRQYQTTRDAAAFTAIVNRHLGLVYAAARRRLYDPAVIDDVCQSVFLVLAKKPTSVRGGRPLAEWLLVVTRYACLNANRQHTRRQRHERAAARTETVMATKPSAESDFAAHLDDALAAMRSADRQAIVLRYYGDADFADVAKALRVSEDTARRRVSRAVERLRTLLLRRGVAPSTATLGATLPAVLVASPPPSLAASVAEACTAPVPPPGISALMEKTLHAMWVAKLKQAAGVVVTLAVVGGVGVTAGVLATRKPPAVAQVPADVPKPAAVPPASAPTVTTARFDINAATSFDAGLQLSAALGRHVSVWAGDPPQPIVFPNKTGPLAVTLADFMQKADVRPLGNNNLMLTPGAFDRLHPVSDTFVALTGPLTRVAPSSGRIVRLDEAATTVPAIEAATTQPAVFRYAVYGVLVADPLERIAGNAMHATPTAIDALPASPDLPPSRPPQTWWGDRLAWPFSVALESPVALTHVNSMAVAIRLWVIEEAAAIRLTIGEPTAATNNGLSAIAMTLDKKARNPVTTLTLGGPVATQFAHRENTAKLSICGIAADGTDVPIVINSSKYDPDSRALTMNLIAQRLRNKDQRTPLIIPLAGLRVRYPLKLSERDVSVTLTNLDVLDIHPLPAEPYANDRLMGQAGSKSPAQWLPREPKQPSNERPEGSR